MRHLALLSSFLLIVFFSCSHNPIIQDVVPISTTTSSTPTCSTCPTNPICAIVDDILVNNSTSYFTCTPQPSGQGSVAIDGASCLIWTPNGTQTDIINTCIVACTDGICDTTYIILYPPLPGDTTTVENPCNPEIVYFETDVLPILSANCAYSGCHNAASYKDGVILDSYTNVINTGKVKANNLSGSKLYESITDNDPDDIMPPPPATALTTLQINTIAKWIQQGAKNEICDQTGQPCNTDNVSYNTYVKPTLASCTSCHKTGNASGGINLDSYAGVKSAALSGHLYGSINWGAGFSPMPQGGNKLSDCTILKVKSWVDAGAPQN